VTEELLIAFAGGLAATLTPCALPLYPGYLAYVAAQRGQGRSADTRWLGVAVLGGVLLAMLTLGAFISSLQLAAGAVLRIMTPLADVVVIGLGLALALGRNPFARLPTLSLGQARGSPLISAFIYGLLYGPIALPCAGPLVLGIFLFSIGIADLAGKLAFFMVFGLGFGLPLLGISLLARDRASTLLRAFARHETALLRVTGTALAVIGAWDLASNVPFALLYLRG